MHYELRLYPADALGGASRRATSAGVEDDGTARPVSTGDLAPAVDPETRWAAHPVRRRTVTRPHLTSACARLRSVATTDRDQREALIAARDHRSTLRGRWNPPAPPPPS